MEIFGTVVWWVLSGIFFLAFLFSLKDVIDEGAVYFAAFAAIMSVLFGTLALGISIPGMIAGALDVTNGGQQFTMSTFFNLITNLLIIAALLVMIFFVGRLIFSGRGQLEVAIRSIAAVAGFLIYFGAKAVGLSIPELMLSAISTTNPASVGFLGIVLPGFVGAIVAWYCLRTIRQHEELGLRLIVLLSTFIVVLFGDAYVASLDTDVISQQGLDLSLLPNLTFTIGIALYIIFRYIPPPSTNSGRSSSTGGDAPPSRGSMWRNVKRENRSSSDPETRGERMRREARELLDLHKQQMETERERREQKQQEETERERREQYRGTDLRAVDLRETDLTKIDLINADLSNANLEGVDLSLRFNHEEFCDEL